MIGTTSRWAKVNRSQLFVIYPRLDWCVRIQQPGNVNGQFPLRSRPMGEERARVR
jgi:hypothetical protein